MSLGAATPIWLTFTVFGLNHIIDMKQQCNLMTQAVGGESRNLIDWVGQGALCGG